MLSLEDGCFSQTVFNPGYPTMSYGYQCIAAVRQETVLRATGSRRWEIHACGYLRTVDQFCIYVTLLHDGSFGTTSTCSGCHAWFGPYGTDHLSRLSSISLAG